MWRLDSTCPPRTDVAQIAASAAHQSNESGDNQALHGQKEPWEPDDHRTNTVDRPCDIELAVAKGQRTEESGNM